MSLEGGVSAARNFIASGAIKDQRGFDAFKVYNREYNLASLFMIVTFFLFVLVASVAWFCLSRDLLVFDHIRDGGYFSNVRDDDKVEGHIRRALAEINKEQEEAAAAERVVASP